MINVKYLAYLGLQNVLYGSGSNYKMIQYNIKLCVILITNQIKSKGTEKCN